MTGAYVRLRLGRERYALSVDSVTAVSEVGTLSAVPGTRETVLGLRNLHGQLLPVFELAGVLAVGHDPQASRVVIVENGAVTAGLAVDEVTDVRALTGTPERTDVDHLSGVVLEDGDLVGVLDVEGLFAALAREAA